MGATLRADMFVDEADDPREVRPPMPDERSTLQTFLRDQRLTLELKCAGLDAEDMAARAVPPSTLSLLGLVRHLADVERSWMRVRMSGGDAPPRYSSPQDRDGAFDHAVADPVLVDEAWAAWREECAFTDAFVVAAADLDVTGHDAGSMHANLRQVLVHLIEEYARHLGHADFLREHIDGRIGQ